MLSSPHFDKKTSILSKTQCSHVIYFKFFMKNPPCHSHISPKNVNSAKTTLYFGPKKIRMPLFSYLSRKNKCSHAHILSKKHPFSKKHTAVMPRACQINVHSLKNTVLSCNFFQFFYENSPALIPFSHKKRKFCQKYTILWVKKLDRMPFFSDFLQKKHCSYTHILSKNVHCLKTRCSNTHILSNKRPFCQKHNALMSFFFIFFMKNPLLSCPLWSKNVKYVKTTLYVPEKSIECLFFRFVTKN